MLESFCYWCWSITPVLKFSTDFVLTFYLVVDYVSVNEIYVDNFILSFTFVSLTRSTYSKTPDSETFRVFKYLLCSKSPVFRAMLNSAMREAGVGEINIRDMKKRVPHLSRKPPG